MSRFSSWIGADLAYALKNTVFAVGFLAAANACGGGGCGGGCGGSSVIPGGFPKDKRVENAAAVRLTRPGLEFIQNNLATVVKKVLEGGGTSLKDGIMTFEIPTSTGSTKLLFININYTVCAGGPKPGEKPPKCVVEIDIGKISGVKIDSVTPKNLKINANIPIRLQRLPMDISVVGNIEATLGNGSCSDVQFVPVPMTVDIALEEVPNDALHAVRAGYTKITIDPNKFSFNKDVIKGAFKFCGSGLNDTIIGWFKGLIADQIVGSLGGQLVGPLASATCMKAQKLDDGTEQCPTGTFNKGGTCRYQDKNDAECVPMLLGIEQRIDLSGALASLSPGTSGGLDIMLASGGNMNPAPGTGAAENGVTLGMLGGGQPVTQSLCVPKADFPLPTGLLLPDVFNANDVPDWTAPTKPHLGIGLSEAYLNHAAAAAYNSGAFCIGISSEQISQLNAGLFSLLLPSIKGLSDKFNPGETSPAMALSIRPQKAPNILVGDNKPDFTSPLLNLKLQDTDLDFYMWSHDRFVRLFTGRIDIGVPINLESGKEGIGLKFAPKTPLQFTNPRISNNTLLLEKDAAVGKLVESIGGLIPASTFSSIKPFKLDSALASFGLKLTIPEGGIRKVTKDSNNWLGVFAYLETATAAVPTTKTTAQLVKSTIDPKNFDLATVGDAPPRFDVHAVSDLDDGTRKIEYAYKVDNGPYTTFFPERDFTATSPFFILQGKHTISVVSRVAGVVESEGEPSVIPVLVDVLPPVVKVRSEVAGTVKILASDIVSTGKDLKVDARIDGGAWVPVPLVEAQELGKVVTTRLVSVPAEATSIEVRATDEAGNVASTSSPLIRGRADSTVAGGGGCGCSVPGPKDQTSTTSLAAFGALAMIGAVMERRRRRATRARQIATASLFIAASGASGCTCASGDETKDEPGASTCNGKPDLVPYVIGSHTSVASAADGTIWVAGYNEGDPSGGTSDDFSADLVVGKYDATKGAVAWTVIDGVPKPAEGTTLDRNNCGFRGGVLDPGDDVGQYTAMVLDSKGNPIVAYFDRTNHALKVATTDGKSFSTHTVQTVEKGWAGKFNSMTTLGGKPVLAYQVMEAGSGGFAKAKVRVAKAQTEVPGSEGDWSIEDAFVDEKSPCVQDVCASGQKCLAGGGGFDPVCTATASGCPAACGDGEACVKDKAGVAGCQKTKPNLGIYINAAGTGIALATAGTDLGVVFYDRVHGNLRASTNKGGKWATTPTTAPLDGWTGDVTKNKLTGDRGIGASLAVDATGNWHVVYADGIKEWLLYKFVPGGDVTKAAAAVVVDDGSSADGSAATAFKDGQHVIGENAHVVVDGSNVKIVYQDSTAGTLRWAKGAGGATAKFTRGAVKQDGFAGFWPRIVGNQALNFFRMKGETENGDALILGNVRAVALP